MFFITKLNPLTRRMLPLYIGAFFQGFVLWYAIEKLFMRGIGFDDASIGVMVAIYSAAMLLIETPSGILADRWSRKGVLIVASVCLAISALICGISNDIPTYFVGAIFWGVFFALYTGTYDSIVYDTLLEERGHTKDFEKHYGRIKIIDSLALVAGSLLGGVIAEFFGLRETYYISVPLALVSIGALVVFREPKLHKADMIISIKEQVTSTFRAIARRGALIPILVALIAFGLIEASLFEFGQLWLIALIAPAIVYGPANALLLGTLGVGGYIARHFRMNSSWLMAVFLVIMLVSILMLILSRLLPVAIIAQAILGIGVVAIGVVLLKLLHDELPSNVRAGSASAVSTLSRLFLIPLALAFGYLSKNESVFNAAWLWFALLVIASIFIVKVRFQGMKLPVVASGDEAVVETYQK